MTARFITKKIVNVIVTTSVGFTVSNVLASNTYLPKPSTSKKVEIMVGSMVVGTMVAGQAGKYTDEQVDALFDWYDATFKKSTPTES
jgi:Na+/H+ antiporter NhaA